MRLHIKYIKCRRVLSSVPCKNYKSVCAILPISFWFMSSCNFCSFYVFSLKAWSSGNVWCCFCFLFYYILFFVCYLEFQCSIFFFLEGIKCSKEKWVILHNWKLSHLESFLFCLLKLIDKTKSNYSTVKCYSIQKFIY